MPVVASAQWGAYGYGYPSYGYGAYGYGYPGYGLTGGYYEGLQDDDWFYDYYDGYGVYDDYGLYDDVGYDYGSVYNLNYGPYDWDDAWDNGLYEGLGYDRYFYR